MIALGGRMINIFTARMKITPSMNNTHNRNIPDRPLEFQMFSLEGVVLVALCCGLLYWSVTSHMEKRRKKHEHDALLKRVMGDDL